MTLVRSLPYLGLMLALSLALAAEAQEAPQPAALSCGNGVKEPELGEVCDDSNTVSGDGCRRDCRKEERCGDGILDAGESCDDGNTVSGDRCPANCRVALVLPLVCGNGIVDSGENCDDGNTKGGDACPSDCFLLSAPSADSKDPRIARQRALLATSLGAPLLGVGLIVGPSVGHIYAGERRHALLASSARLFFAVVSVAGFTNVLDSKTKGFGLSVIGLVGWGGLILYDLRDAPRAVKRTAKTTARSKPASPTSELLLWSAFQ